jgi:hypothetical protein
MNTSLTTDNFSINLTDVSPDADDPSRNELTFNASISLAHALTTPFGIDDPAEATDFYSDGPIDFELNIASRHDNGLYHIIKGDHSGDYIEYIDDVTYAYGAQITDFLTQICAILKVPFYPEDDS